MSDLIGGSVETQADIGKDDAAVVRRWLLELKLADKDEKKWRECVAKLWKRYRSENQQKSSFNIFWPNTDVLRQAVYSALPKPDVRRRYRDDDPIGKAVSEVLLRSLEFTRDAYDLDLCIKQDVLDMLVGGRGLSRVRYIPSLVSMENADKADQQAAEQLESDDSADEELAWEQVICEHVDYSDFRRGPGKVWTEVGWVAFRHKLRRDELEKRFGEKGAKLPLNGVADEDIERADRDHPETTELFKTAEVWEIWDRDKRQVLFISEANPKEPLDVTEDPLKLEQFFPVPRPIYAIEDTESLIPTPLYGMYAEQADELNRLSRRINKIIEALKVRGIYDATLGEMSQLFKGDDNDLIPAQSVAALIERGGLDRFIWFAPIEQMAAVLRELMLQRDQCKQVIYEITGISDIVRGSTVASETATAQQLKSKWGSLRLQRMQGDVQRYVRDLIRLQAEVISGMFQQQTLQQMTLLPYPTEEQWKLQLMQMQQQAMMAQQQGQPPAPMPPQPVTWEQIIEVLRNDAQRSYRVDIETDSTIAADLQEENQSLMEILGEMGTVMPGLMQAVGAGFMPFDAAKEILLTLCRRAKLGSAVEDEIEKMQPPPPPTDQAGAQLQAEQQMEQFKAQLQDQQHQRELQVDLQHEQMMAQIELQKEASRQQFQHAQVEAQNQLEAQRMQLEQSNNAALEQMRIASEERIAAAEQQIQLLIAQLNTEAKIEVAEIQANSDLMTQQLSNAQVISVQEIE